MDLNSFLTSLGTSFLIFLVLMLLFTWLSRKPGNNVVYYPNRVIKGLDPWDGGSRTRNPFAWIKEALSSTEQDVITMSGVDAAVYFVFLTTALGIMTLSGVALLPVLLPIAATDHSMKTSNATSKGSFDDLDRLSMGHIGAGSPRLWAFLIATYWVSFVVYFVLWKAYRHVSDLRATALMSPEVKAEQFAILVRDIPSPPEGQTRKEQVDSYFKTIYPDTFYRSMVVTDNKEVNKIWNELEGYKKKLARAEAIYSQSKKTGTPEGIRPTNKTGFLGILGTKVDSIEYYTEKINETVPKLEAEQKVTLREKQLGAAVIFFTNREIAVSAGQCLHAQMVDTWRVMEAPEPRQLVWSNLHKKMYERLIRQSIVYIVVGVTILFYLIPIGFISALTTLQNLKKILPFLKPIVDIVAVRTILQAYLPQIALIMFLALLPMFLMFLSKAEGIPSESHATRAASGKYYYFTVLNVFIAFTISGTLFETFKDIQEDTSLILPLLAKSLPANATFFLTFVALRFFVGYGLELSRMVPLIIFHVKRKYLCKTEAELKEAWTPGDLGYATRVPSDLLIITIVLCYSVIAPIILLFGVLYFAIGWLVLRNQTLKVFVPRYESYGRMWPHMHKRILASLVLFQVLMVGFFPVKEFWYTPFVFPLPILSGIFGVVCNKKFYHAFQSTPLEVVCREVKETPNMDEIFRSYVPVALGGENKSEDEHALDALSQVTRTAPMVV